jgi:hypothetical protein
MILHILKKSFAAKGCKCSLCPPWKRMGKWRHSSIFSLGDGDEWSALGPGRFTAGETARGTHCIGDWVGPRVGMDIAEKKMFSCPCLEWTQIPRRPAHSLIAITTGPSIIIIIIIIIIVNSCYYVRQQRHSALRPEYQVSWLTFFVCFLSPYRESLGEHLEISHDRFLPIHNSLIIPLFYSI